MARTCTPCVNLRTDLLGDGTFASLDKFKANSDKYFETIRERQRTHGKHYKLEPGVITRGTVELAGDVYFGRVCSTCHTLLNV